MIHQIPELGAVAVGNQIGRVALLTLTKWPAIEEDRGKIPVSADIEDYAAFKISAILPLQSQVDGNLRPEEPLLGMAIGPIQGQCNSGGELKRYRLFMTYHDHTILSYEISREVPGGQLTMI